MSRRSKVTLTVSVGVFMASLDLFIVNIAFPDIQRDFHGASLSGLSWVLNAYAIAFAALLVPAGRWADRAGRKRAFLGGLAVFSLASAACAAAPSVGALVAARVVQAIGAAFLLPTSLGLLLPEYPPAKRGAAVGIWAAVGGVAAASGPTIGGALVQAGWRWVFIVNVPIGLLTLVAASGLLREVRDRSGSRPDVLGAILFSAGIASLTLAIVKGHQWGWSSARVLGLFATAAVLVLAVAIRSTRHPAPLIEPVIARTRAIALANLGALLFFSAFGALLLGSVLFQTTVWHDSVLRAGLQITPGPAMAAIFAFPGGVLGQRIGQRYVGAAGALLFAAGMLWFRTHMGTTPHYASELLPAQVLAGTGVGLVLPTLSAAATGPLPPARFATGTAVLGMSRQLGSALGVAILVAIIGTPTPGDVLSAFQGGWTFMVGAALAAAIVLLSVGPVRIGSAVPAGDPSDAGAPATVAEVAEAASVRV
ncbi:MAG TPA: DHA2 family efflux MFS transporter permease subunit [Solirubrobacteraceae bacterium]|nr:DHA2 family efflux MFS transporter permease subunit [Solirubrobacteraceae bacterium]